MLNSQWSSLWAIMGVLLIHSVAGVHSLCRCWDMDTEVKMMSSKATKVDKEKQLRKIKNDNTAYKMHHFRWNTPALSKKKRYGGFMTSEHSHTPLVTLFKNAIIKTAYKKGQ
ncbi:Pro-opiomelanocortin, partial [Ophiophagus hannah]